MKPQFITVDNYQKFKPSELVRSFVADIQVAKKKMKQGYKMDMQSWEPYNHCLPCLGGMACLNMSITPHDGIGLWISYLGDAIRTGRDGYMNNALFDLYENYRRTDFPSKPEIERGTTKNLDILIDRIHMYANILEESGQ